MAKKHPPYIAAFDRLLKMQAKAKALEAKFDAAGDDSAGMTMARLSDTIRATYDDIAAARRRREQGL